MDFTIEERNLLCIYDTADRNTLMTQLRDSMADVEDEDMLWLMRRTLAKLAGMRDAEFAALVLFSDGDDEEMEV